MTWTQDTSATILINKTLFFRCATLMYNFYPHTLIFCYQHRPYVEYFTNTIAVHKVQCEDSISHSPYHDCLLYKIIRARHFIEHNLFTMSQYLVLYSRKHLQLLPKGKGCTYMCLIRRIIKENIKWPREKISSVLSFITGFNDKAHSKFKACGSIRINW